MKSSNVGRSIAHLLSRSNHLFKRHEPQTEHDVPESVPWEVFTMALAEVSGKPDHAFFDIPDGADPVDHVVGIARDHVNMLRPKSSRMNMPLQSHRIRPYQAKYIKRNGSWVLYAVVKAKIMAICVPDSPELGRNIKAFTLSEPLASQRGILLSSFPTLVVDIPERRGKFYGDIERFEDTNRPTLDDHNQHGKR